MVPPARSRSPCGPPSGPPTKIRRAVEQDVGEHRQGAGEEGDEDRRGQARRQREQDARRPCGVAAPDWRSPANAPPRVLSQALGPPAAASRPCPQVRHASAHCGSISTIPHTPVHADAKRRIPAAPATSTPGPRPSGSVLERPDEEHRAEAEAQEDDRRADRHVLGPGRGVAAGFGLPQEEVRDGPGGDPGAGAPSRRSPARAARREGAGAPAGAGDGTGGRAPRPRRTAGSSTRRRSRGWCGPRSRSPGSRASRTSGSVRTAPTSGASTLRT